MIRGQLLLSVLVCASCASGSSPVATAPAKVAPPAAEPARGIATITAAELKAHVAVLAADDMAGRETLQPGYEAAAGYLARAFERDGLVPLPGQSSFAVDYVLDQQGFDAKTRVVLHGEQGERELALETDYVPFGFSDAGTASAPVVFVGYGITDPKLDHDDYAGLDVKGKLVLVLRHQPNEKDEKSRFSGTEHGLFATKALNAQRHGAVGMILVTDPLNHPEGDDFRGAAELSVPLTEEEKARAEAKAAAAKADPHAAPPAHGKRGMHRSKGKRKPAPSGPFLAVHVSRTAAAGLVGADLAAWQKALDAGDKRPRDFALAGARAEITIKREPVPREVRAKNVIGFLQGADPAVRDQWVVIGGHYDHLGSFHGDGDTVYNGADDNASGTAGVLELAQAFAGLAARPRRSIVFVGFSGEEKGLLGSYAAVAQKILPAERIVFMLNLDMIGRNPEKPVEVLGDAYGTGVREAIDAANADVRLSMEHAGTSYAGNSDHHPFFASDIPVMFFFTGIHDDYHQLGDHADKLSYDRMEQIVKVAYGVTERIASADVPPRFIHQIPWLGVKIELVGEGAAARAVITAVDGDSRASRAGLAAGDALVKIGAASVDEPARIGKLFRDIEPGTRVALMVARGDQPVTVQVDRAKTGYLGVMPGDLEPEAKKRLGLPAGEGLLIRGVTPGGPAAKGGMQDGDIVIRIGGLPVDGSTLTRHLARIGAGEKVAVVVIRGKDAARVTLNLVLGERPGR